MRRHNVFIGSPQLLIMNYYPTPQHERAAEKIVEVFSKDERVKTILLFASCARGKACKDSCLDVWLFVDGRNVNAVNEKFKQAYGKYDVFKKLQKVGEYSHVDWEVTDGKVVPGEHGWTTGPDDYELSVGNLFVYSVALFDRDGYFKRQRRKYVPYYSETLRKKRFAEAKFYMNNNIDHVAFYVQRGLYFAAFQRLYLASKEFLQALFIKRKVYPISYNKWIKEQLVDVLGEPKLYKEFVKLREIGKLESVELASKAELLGKLAKKFL